MFFTNLQWKINHFLEFEYIIISTNQQQFLFGLVQQRENLGRKRKKKVYCQITPILNELLKNLKNTSQ